ncbi:7TM diverse intracellular signaling domain-containing protein [Pedobacter antarcticus]|uniref:sensor histidine kinase n=1 Tax=Pedobacter antarcticus TaxID=34086 RepID=UPI001C55EF40|nr:7TM diverse intracellular signaling domain-containing protein [Pedobacter antarcticus]
MTLFKRILICFILLISGQSAIAASGQDSILNFSDDQRILRMEKGIFLFRDPGCMLSFDKILKKKFNYLDQAVPNIGITSDRVWIRFTVQNTSKSKDLMLVVAQPALDSLVLYQQEKNGFTESVHLGKYKKFSDRLVLNANYLFPVSIPLGGQKTFYVQVSSTDQIQLPVYLGTSRSILVDDNNRNILFGLYAGIILIMILYNLFISFTVKDSSYLFYIIYIFFVGLTQATFQGYAFKYLWPGSPWLAINSSVLVPFFSGITTALFLIRFLQTKKNTPVLHNGILFFIGLYIITLSVWFSGYHTQSIKSLQTLALLGSLYFLFVANAIRRKGSRPALFFLIAYTIFLLAVVIFVLRNFNVVPYNMFTSYILEIGSVIQITLLSFALADKINIYRKDKEQSQEQALQISKENERLIREQNIELETQVNIRTEELQKSNYALNDTLKDLKEAQSQLVDAEKMAGLGQLTAGIAHEINNPINFVTSNIKPLRMDINDLYDVIAKYEQIDPEKDIALQLDEVAGFKRQIDLEYIKTEINSLLSGIGDGANRTAEIIRSLKNFSRLDESDTKPVDINEGLESTLILLRSTIPENIEVIKDLHTLPQVECLPGKINQVFMNLITNAIQAIKMKKDSPRKEQLCITTKDMGDSVQISIRDTGPGMTEEIKQKIFEPFFTTKEVGEGTGLGLSIVFSIIEKHKGNIEVITSVNSGSEFIITLPVNIV